MSMTVKNLLQKIYEQIVKNLLQKIYEHDSEKHTKENL